MSNPLPKGFFSRVVNIQARTAGGANSTDTFQLVPPAGSIAILGCSMNPVSSTVTNYGIVNLFIADKDKSNPISLSDFAFAKGTKSATGCVPIDVDNQSIWVNVSTVDASVQYGMTFLFLIGPNVIPVPAVPFLVSGGPDVIVDVTFTSATTTAQTVDFSPIGSIDVLEVLAAWFYTTSTATGNFGYFDGTTRVDVDTTTAVATYAFNVGAKGARAVYGNNTFTPQVKVRFVIGAPGASTTTLVVQYRASVTR